MRKRYIVIDYDPSVVEHMEAEGIRHGYGDAADVEFLEELNIEHTKFIVSTINDKTINTALLDYVRKHNPDCTFVCHADSYESAGAYYRLGATYVMLPHFLGSERISSFIKKHGYNNEVFRDFRKRQVMTVAQEAPKS